MQFLVPLAGLLGIEIQVLREQVKRSIALYGAMALFFGMGIVFLGAASFFAAAQRIGLINAALSFGGVFIALGLIVFVMIKAGAAKQKRILAEKRRTHDSTAFITTAALTALPALPGLLKSPIVRNIALPAAAVAAFLMVRGRSRPD